MNNKTVTCPKCGTIVKLPLAWILGVEIVFRCRECKQPFKTGFKMGAFMFGIALALALGTANILVFIFSSITLPLVALLIVPLWIVYGFFLRYACLVSRIRRHHKRSLRNAEGTQHT